ncbi:MAG TPA: hypothetical protein VFW48_00835, partial [Solirubrobacterales bacterium]|nr:hypothetical protein [Solirubrobacterales bacterium]
IDISDRLAERARAGMPEPWWWEESDKAATKWTARSWVWRPPPFEPRIVRQSGVFLVGGVPTTSPLRNAKVDGDWRPMRVAEVRGSMSVPFQLIGYEQALAAFNNETLAGQPPKVRAFTLRVQGKPKIREELERAFDLSHRTLFPDFPGMAAYGRNFRNGS